MQVCLQSTCVPHADKDFAVMLVWCYRSKQVLALLRQLRSLQVEGAENMIVMLPG